MVLTCQFFLPSGERTKISDAEVAQARQSCKPSSIRIPPRIHSTLVTFGQARFDKYPARDTRLLVDNTPVHTFSSELKAELLAKYRVRAEFLPPNMTSAVQPMDQGIIRSLKAKHRTRMLPPRPDGMSDEDYKAHTEPWKAANFGIVDVTEFLVDAWDDVDATTIQRYFRKSGIMTAGQLADM